MRYNLKKLGIIFAICIVILMNGVVLAHSGRTDSNGGHKDNKNVSGLGSYHYHCGGHPAHLHENGICPYASNATKSSSSSSTKTSTIPDTIEVTDIVINEKIDKMKVGQVENVSATITPSNATNKSIIWTSSDESIAKISSTGKITAKQAGTVYIIATSINGKTSKLKITIEEEQKVENNNVAKTSTTNVRDSIDNQEESNQLSGIVTLGLLGGGGYLGYKKFKNGK